MSISKVSTPQYNLLTIAALCFWNLSFNFFQFNFGMMGPTIFYVCRFLGLLVDGEIVMSMIEDMPNFAFGKYDFSYFAFINREFKETTEVSDRELFACILLWLCKFIFCPPSCRITSEFILMAKALASGKKLTLAM